MEPTARPFVPPFCPRTDCPHHHCPAGWRYRRFGTYTRQAEPRTIQRFRCGHCGVTFSTQTFATTYYLKRPELLEPLFFRLLACSGYRQLAREARCAPTTAMRQAARLGRHALLFLARHRPAGPLAEPLVVDGFESFAFSQYHPLHLNVAVGADSHYVYAFTHARLRRKGRMTARQKRRRAALEREHGRADPKALERGMAQLLRLAAPEPQGLSRRAPTQSSSPGTPPVRPAWRVHASTASPSTRSFMGSPL